MPTAAQLCSPAPAHPAEGPEQIYDEYFGFVWRNLRRLGVPEATLDDAAQDVFLVVFRRWGDFEGRSSVRTWLFGIVLRVARDQRKQAQRRRRRLVFLDELADNQAPKTPDALGPDALATQHEATRLLHSLLEQLEASRRAVFILVELEQMSVPEAAESLGWKLNTAYARLRAARQTFEAALARHRARNLWRRG